MMLSKRASDPLWRPIAQAVPAQQHSGQITMRILSCSGVDAFQHRQPSIGSVSRLPFAGKDSHLQHGAPPIDALTEPRFRPVEKTDAQKLALAKDLSQWMESLLKEKKTQVAVVSRQGSAQAKQFDQTGMTHSGIAVYNPDSQAYVIYNLIHVDGDPRKGITPEALVWKTTPVDFFYEQLGHNKDALVMIPPVAIQQKMRQGIESGEYKKLYFTRDYNMVSEPHTTRSLNCTKWILMNVLAADMNNYEPLGVLRKIEQTFTPALVDVNPLFRPIAKRTMPFILPDEIPAWEPIHSVSVESLYHSGLFPERQFYVPRTLPPNMPQAPSAFKTYAPLALGGLLLMALSRRPVGRQIAQGRRFLGV